MQVFTVQIMGHFADLHAAKLIHYLPSVSVVLVGGSHSNDKR
jgi:hypothetical protein